MYPHRFNRVCYPPYSATPGWAEGARRFQARTIMNPDVTMHHFRHWFRDFDAWSLLGPSRARCWCSRARTTPVCPLPVVEELAARLPAATTRLVRLPGARHTVFRDRPDPALPAVTRFLSEIDHNVRSWESMA